MVDLKVLEAMHSTQERLKEVFTATRLSETEMAAMPEETRQEAQDTAEENVKIRERFEKYNNALLSEQVSFSLRNFQLYSAVDVAWDAPPINKDTYPLLLYAQGKLDLGNCAKNIKHLPGTERYVTKDTAGNIIGIDLPKFFEVNFNLVRSVITRRLAAQANKYNSLYPFYKYEARSTSLVAKLRADVLSQVMDIMTDAFDFRHHDTQVVRDAMMYGHCVDFARASWEKEQQTIFDPEVNPELRDKKNPKFKSVITKEGVGWVNPHPSRTFWDNAYPLSSLNSDTGCEYVGFWDVIRYGDVSENPKYWNRKIISYSSTLVNLFSTYAQYFSQYYCTITPPCDLNSMDLSSPNDRLNNIGMYAQTLPSSSMIIANIYRKIVPKEYSIGDYPYPVWLRQVVAGDKTTIYAEFMPSSPGALCSINENDSRQLNISIAMELLPYQDQMTQLLSMLMLTLQSSNFKVLAIDVDLMTPQQVKEFRDTASAKNKYPAVQVLEYSGVKFRELGMNPKTVVDLMETQPSQAINQIFQAMTQLVALAERLMALSPHELGQPAPREISATETNMMAGTTETIYGFISDSVDAFRAAKKRILYESYMVCGDPNIRVPVLNRYTKKTIQKAGFDILDEDEETFLNPEEPAYHTLTGTKNLLYYNYIFTSRDGALRAVNTQAANVLVQLLGTLQNPMVIQSMSKEKYFDILNEIFRLSGAGVDLNLEVNQGDSNQIGPDRQAQLEQVMSQLVQHAEQDKQEIDGVAQKVDELMNIVKELVDEVQRIDQKPTSVDPMDFLKAKQQMTHEDQKASLNFAQGVQRMSNDQEKHDLGMRLMRLKENREKQQSAYAK